MHFSIFIILYSSTWVGGNVLGLERAALGPGDYFLGFRHKKRFYQNF